jgi:hypothetical protein
MLGKLALSGCCLGLAKMSLSISIIVILRTRCGYICPGPVVCLGRDEEYFAYDACCDLRSCSYMFRPDEIDVEVAHRIRGRRRAGPGSLLKTRLQRGGTARSYKCKHLQGQPLPGRLKLGAQYQCLTTCLFLETILLVLFLQSHPSHLRTPAFLADRKRRDRSPSRGFGKRPILYVTWELLSEPVNQRKVTRLVRH